MRSSRPTCLWCLSLRRSLRLCNLCTWLGLRFGLAYLDYLRSAKIDRSFVGTFPCLCPNSFIDGLVYAVEGAVVQSVKPDACGSLVEDDIFPTQDVVWSIASEDSCSFVHVVAHLHPSQRRHPKVLEIPSNSLAVFHRYEIAFDAEGGWDLSDILPSYKTDIRSSIQANFTVICYEGVEHSVENPVTAVVGECGSGAQSPLVVRGSDTVTLASHIFALSGVRGCLIGR